MSDSIRFPKEAWIPAIAGLFWLWVAPGHGWLLTAFALIPGSMLLGSGVAMLLMPGDSRTTHVAALGGLLGVLIGLPAWFAVGFAPGLLLIAASAAGFVTAGSHALRLELPTAGVPAPIPSLALSAQVAADEALLGTMVASLPFPGRGETARIDAEVREARELFDSRGWLEKPADYHVAPPDLETPLLRAARTHGVHYEHLSFESSYAPHPDEPGRERWLSYAANRTAHAWVLRHPGPERPWLMCVHGFQMGMAAIDLAAFQPDWLHHRLGLNLIVPVLPLHGARKQGRRSGDGFLSGDILDSIHAEAQAMWDLRRVLSWVRDQGEPEIGVLGYSLGGYNTALLASLDDRLACAIPGIPLADIPRAVLRHGPPLELRHADEHDLDLDRMTEVMRVVSPLALTPKVPRERRYLFAAVSDRLVPPDQIRDLWEHWERPRIEWYQGAHITFRAHPRVRRLIEEGLHESGLS